MRFNRRALCNLLIFCIGLKVIREVKQNCPMWLEEDKKFKQMLVVGLFVTGSLILYLVI